MNDQLYEDNRSYIQAVLDGCKRLPLPEHVEAVMAASRVKLEIRYRDEKDGVVEDPEYVVIGHDGQELQPVVSVADLDDGNSLKTIELMVSKKKQALDDRYEELIKLHKDGEGGGGPQSELSCKSSTQMAAKVWSTEAVEPKAVDDASVVDSRPSEPEISPPSPKGKTRSSEPTETPLPPSPSHDPAEENRLEVETQRRRAARRIQESKAREQEQEQEQDGGHDGPSL